MSSLRSLLILGKLMTEGADEAQILQLATTAAPSLARCRVVGVVLAGPGTGAGTTPSPCRHSSSGAIARAVSRRSSRLTERR